MVEGEIEVSESKHVAGLGVELGLSLLSSWHRPSPHGPRGCTSYTIRKEVFDRSYPLITSMSQPIREIRCG